MRELDQYLGWCDSLYQSLPHCKCGKSCTNSNYCNGQQSNCYACIRRVHDYRNRTVHYNCEKMLYFYVLKHGYRFGSEIYYLFNSIKRIIKKWDHINIVSIGCGPCTELFGALSLWRRLGKSDATFHFRGYDLEQMWVNLMNYVQVLFQNMDVETNNSDAITSLIGTQEPVDIIVFNYMLSDMLKFHPLSFNGFLDSLCDLVRDKTPKFILVNDIYLKVSLNASSQIVNVLRNNGFSFNIVKSQYPSLNGFIGQHGNIIQRDPMCNMDPHIEAEYEPFPDVNSIQTIIQFT